MLGRIVTINEPTIPTTQTNTPIVENCISIDDSLSVECIEVSASSNEQCIQVNTVIPYINVTPSTLFPPFSTCEGITDRPELTITLINGEVPVLDVNVDSTGLIYTKDFDTLEVTITNYDPNFTYTGLEANSDSFYGGWQDNQDGTLVWSMGDILDDFPHKLWIYATEDGKCISEIGFIDVITMKRSSQPILTHPYLGFGGDILEVTIDNYKPTSQYTINVNTIGNYVLAGKLLSVVDDKLTVVLPFTINATVNFEITVSVIDTLKYQSVNSINSIQTSPNIHRPVYIYYIKMSPYSLMNLPDVAVDINTSVAFIQPFHIAGYKLSSDNAYDWSDTHTRGSGIFDSGTYYFPTQAHLVDFIKNERPDFANKQYVSAWVPGGGSLEGYYSSTQTVLEFCSSKLLKDEILRQYNISSW